MAQKVVDAREGARPAGSDAWFWAAALEPEDDLRPYWETIDFLPRPAATQQQEDRTNDPT